MVAAVNVFAGKGKAAIPAETVRALCKVFISFGRIAPCIEIANVTLDRLMHQIIPRTIFAWVEIQRLDVERQVRGRPPFTYLLSIGSSLVVERVTRCLKVVSL